MPIKKSKNILIAIVVVILLLAVFILPKFYFKYFANNIKVNEKTYLYVPTGATFQQLKDSIAKGDFLKRPEYFFSLATDRELQTKFKSGKYAILPGMTNRALTNMLIAGNQEPVDISFRNVRLKGNFAKLMSKKLEFDSAALMNLLDSSQFVGEYGFTKDNVYTMFIPNSYEMFWNTSAKDFFQRMNKEYKTFWNPERLKKAEELKMTPQQVTVLASIVDAEALADKEMPTIAGLYLNRLRRGIKLEADPTVIFANNDFTIRRVLNRHLTKESPYNTYRNFGLPPGPIMMPSINAIDATLNPEKHNYIYMCAKEDFSGYHNFASTLSEHLVNARKFQAALNQRNIKK
ncbi:aminodeoxychorismate lyase [Pseudopedobacter saltans DSM 12145]|uniref:Endolytic murein transglycosylase n=1 Tax=Pseudopedobacter saltans (strain ATCC 51119 / DSM 12145 / JCM 21818 / CCUG 39354 / LMG 10337 / NBRC 100064 / NCIMB 13643) TaxID=762903 RepID=F0SBK3_PSESL|nr:aminodeoxychorismate lyase [Pseudopedobacter saltans DSM 12145]